MFGKRSDGVLVRHDDPIIALVPYVMPMRCDAQVMLHYKADYEKLARFIVQKGREGHQVTFMDIMISAFVRAVAELPEINRFIANKRVYARREIAVSFALLQDTPDGSVKENTVKCLFDPRDTLFDVSQRIKQSVVKNRPVEADNSTMKVARVLQMPILANLVVGAARLLDRYGILPRYIIDASPFHTSMFITNMASIGMPAVNHHIYNFGTTSLFVSIGSVERTVALNDKGEAVRKRLLPIGIVADERVAAGMVFAQLVAIVQKYLSDPQLLEQTPEEVHFDQGVAIALGTPNKKRRFKMPRAFKRRSKIERAARKERKRKAS